MAPATFLQFPELNPLPLAEPASAVDLRREALIGDVPAEVDAFLKSIPGVSADEPPPFALPKEEAEEAETAPSGSQPYRRWTEDWLVAQAELADAFVDAPKVRGSRVAEEFLARLEVSSSDDCQQLSAFADIGLRKNGDQSAVVLRCLAGSLTLALVSVLDLDVVTPSDIPPPALHWKFAPASGDATARADVLDFLRSVHDGGLLRILRPDGQRVGSFTLPGAPFPEDLEHERRLLHDLATLEEWSGVVLSVPTHVEAETVERVVQAAEMVRTRRVPVRLQSDVEAVMAFDTPYEADEIVVEQDLGVEVFGHEVPLGVGTARLQVDLVDVRPEGESTRVTFRPRDTEIEMELRPPAARDAYKRTLAPGEAPTQGPSSSFFLSADWQAGEREAEEELRADKGDRFDNQDQFFAWLTSIAGRDSD